MGSDTRGWSAWAVFNFIVDVIFIVDIIVNFRTGYLVDGVFIDDGRLAAYHYLKGSFAVDLVASFPLNLVLAAGGDDDVTAASHARTSRSRTRVLTPPECQSIATCRVPSVLS